MMLPSYRLDERIAVITLDDGKANALAPSTLETLDGALDRALDEEASAVVIVGRDGRFSAGFDLGVMASGPDEMRALVAQGGRLLAKLYGLALPTVAACTGHALAAGALLLLSIDHRVGTDQPAKIGLNEVAIGMGLPVYAVELARDRLTTRAFGPATMGAQLYDPAGAVEAGYLDRIVPADAVVDEAIADARRLGELRTGAYAHTKRRARARTIDHILATLDADIESLTGPPP